MFGFVFQLLQHLEVFRRKILERSNTRCMNPYACLYLCIGTTAVCHPTDTNTSLHSVTESGPVTADRSVSKLPPAKDSFPLSPAGREMQLHCGHTDWQEARTVGTAATSSSGWRRAPSCRQLEAWQPGQKSLSPQAWGVKISQVWLHSSLSGGGAGCHQEGCADSVSPG